MADKQTITVFTGRTGKVGLLADSKVQLPVDELRNNLEDFMAKFSDILAAADKKPAKGLGLKSVSVALGVDGKGRVGFLGTGVYVGASASLTLTFERS